MEINPILLIFFAVQFLVVHNYTPRLYTCEFDLVRATENASDYWKPWPPSFLSDECRSVFNKRFTDAKTFQLYLDEATAFKKFTLALENFEAKKSGKKLCANREYALYISERQQFYKQVDLCECYKLHNYESFQHCLIQKRNRLTKIINDATN